MVAQSIVGTRGDGAVGLNKDRARDPIALSASRPVQEAKGVFLHDIEQDTVEVLAVSADTLFKPVSVLAPA